MAKAPIVIIAFNRPDCTRRVLAAVRQQQDRDLFLVLDGPRPDRPDDLLAIGEVRGVLEELEWSRRVRTNFAAKNMGLRGRVVSGLSWVFEQTERAIILEDDCVPSEDFFVYCDYLLDRFADDSRVMSVCGTDYASRCAFPEASFYFSKYTLFWGWATWRRAWRHYDDKMTALENGELDVVLRSTFDLFRARWYWSAVLRRVHQDRLQSWGYRWLLSCWINRGLCVYPTANLVRNIGFGDSAAHTSGRSEYDRGATEPLRQPMVAPPVMVADPIADRAIEDRYFSKDLRHRLAWALRSFGRFVGRPGALASCA